MAKIFLYIVSIAFLVFFVGNMISRALGGPTASNDTSEIVAGMLIGWHFGVIAGRGWNNEKV